MKLRTVLARHIVSTMFVGGIAQRYETVVMHRGPSLGAFLAHCDIELHAQDEKQAAANHEDVVLRVRRAEALDSDPVGFIEAALVSLAR